MNCNIFKKRLEDYVLGNTSDDLKEALESHMEQCDSCRELYENEVKIDSAFRSVLSVEGIQFNSSRPSIINSIDKNRYSKKTSNKIFYNFRRYKSRYLSYMVAAIAMVIFIPMVLKNFSGAPYKSEMARNNNAIYKESEENSDAAITKRSAEDSMEMPKTKQESSQYSMDSSASAKKVNIPIEFKSSIITKADLPDFKMNWENSPDGKISAAIDTRPEKDVDFGIHVIYTENINTGEIVKYEASGNDRQFTPRNIEWWDNENLIVVAGFGFGTISYGSQVYNLDINAGKFSTLYLVKDEKYQILDVERDKNDLILQLIIYEDDNYMTSHMGVGKMTLLKLDKLVDMQIVSEEKR
jgi:hypothetical protein